MAILLLILTGMCPDTCRHGNGLSIEAGGRVENLTLDGNDFRQNFNNGVCIANNGDFSRSTVTNNKFHNNGVGDYINSVAEAPYGDGFGVYHDHHDQRRCCG
jgi:hypothetical protein